MRLKDNCRIISLRGRHLLSTGDKTLEVNQSFADIWEIAAEGPFTTESLVEQIVEKYDISRPDTEREISGVIEIWNSYNLLEESD